MNKLLFIETESKNKNSSLRNGYGNDVQVIVTVADKIVVVQLTYLSIQTNKQTKKHIKYLRT